MRDILAVRSIPLSAETSDAWRKAGIVFRRRTRDVVWDPRFHENRYKAVLNLGNLEMNFQSVPVPVFNPPDLIVQVSSPAAIRKALDSFLPPPTVQGPHWHKRSGWRGQGKVFHEVQKAECAVLGGDIQAHIEGTEYRILTVDGAVVQATKKSGTAPNFEFEWVGVDGIKKGGFISTLKEASDAIAGFGKHVIGWDVIHNGSKPFILEANTSPGVNDASAQRIVDQIRRVI